MQLTYVHYRLESALGQIIKQYSSVTSKQENHTK